ncbi:MAG: hypothetical protein FD149_1364 [Rhodospirillaceae bacterium]|nr:MAG: hypothetical protein FD149_1364 [Rhodospirillaceae bacterium]
MAGSPGLVSGKRLILKGNDDVIFRRFRLFRLSRSHAMAAGLVVGLFVPHPAAGLDFTTTGNIPIEILAEEGIEWQQDKKQIVARGDVRGTRGTLTVRADVLTAHYRDRGTGSSEVHHLRAEGGVHIASPTETASGDRADYDVDTQLLVLTGHPARLETPTEALTAEGEITYDEARRVAVAQGNVHVVTKEGRTLRAGTVTADLFQNRNQNRNQKESAARMKPDTGQIKRLTAEGQVRIETPTEIVKGEHGVYNAETGIATLTGAVKITHGDDQINGTYAVVDLKAGVSRLYAAVPGSKEKTKTKERVKLLIAPERKNGRGGKKDADTSGPQGP